MVINNKSIINTTLANRTKDDVQNQYFLYKKRVENIYLDFQNLKKEAELIGRIFQQMQDQNLIDNHISTMINLTKNYKQNPSFSKYNENLKKIENYYNKVQQTCLNGLKLIFEIREFFTNQKFIMYLEQGGKLFEFSINDIDKHANSIIPIYTNSLDKMIKNMISSSKAIAPELRKLGLSLKNLDKDNEIKEISEYQNFVSYHFSKNKIKISENRSLEAAVYLYSRKQNVNFNDKSERHSLHIMLGQYLKKGGLSENITMYKLGDAIHKTREGFVNVEIKMHSGTISLNMIANGIKNLYDAFTQETLEKQQEKLIKMFTANEDKLSSKIEKEAQKDAIKNINQIFSFIK